MDSTLARRCVNQMRNGRRVLVVTTEAPVADYLLEQLADLATTGPNATSTTILRNNSTRLLRHRPGAGCVSILSSNQAAVSARGRTADLLVLWGSVPNDVREAALPCAQHAGAEIVEAPVSEAPALAVHLSGIDLARGTRKNLEGRGVPDPGAAPLSPRYRPKFSGTDVSGPFRHR